MTNNSVAPSHASGRIYLTHSKGWWRIPCPELLPLFYYPKNANGAAFLGVDRKAVAWVACLTAVESEVGTTPAPLLRTLIFRG